jgi:hypothetical protein
MTEIQQSHDNQGYMEILIDGQLRGMFQEMDNATIAIRHESNGKSFKSFEIKDQAIEWLCK